MTENLTKAKELYQDIANALSSQITEVDRKEVLRLAFELYLICELGEKLCVERGKIKPKPEEHIATIIERCSELFEKNADNRAGIMEEREESIKRTVGVFNKTVEI